MFHATLTQNVSLFVAYILLQRGDFKAFALFCSKFAFVAIYAFLPKFFAFEIPVVFDKYHVCVQRHIFVVDIQPNPVIAPTCYIHL